MTNKNEQRKVPELRFPEYSGEWEEKELNEIASFYKGKGISKRDISEEGVNCILYGELYTKYGYQINEIYSHTDLDEKSLFEGLKNDVLIPSSGETAIDIATASNLNINNVYLGGDINVIRPIKEYNGHFISLSINGKNKKELSKLAQGKTVVHLYNNELKKLKINFPSIKEQQKIGEFFSKLDRQIELEEKKLALLEEQKKGYMQKIFSQELRFKDENGEEYPEWEENKLRNCSEYKTSNITIKSLSNEMSENLFPVYDANNIVGWSSDFQFNEGYISIIKDGAGAGRIRSLPAYSSILGTMGGITPNHKMMHLGFLYLILERINFGVFTTGSTIPHIYYSDYSRVQIPLPSKEEQLKISTFFNNIEQQQNCLKNKIKNLVIQKKELLTKIFV